jgi:hypothetical protein
LGSIIVLVVSCVIKWNADVVGGSQSCLKLDSILTVTLLIASKSTHCSTAFRSILTFN